jgi:hypothetical protein
LEKSPVIRRPPELSPRLPKVGPAPRNKR